MEIICEIKQTKSCVELVQVLCSCTIILYERYPFFFHQRVEKTPIDKPSIRVPLNFHVSFQIRVQYSPLFLIKFYLKLLVFLNLFKFYELPLKEKVTERFYLSQILLNYFMKRTKRNKKSLVRN